MSGIGALGNRLLPFLYSIARLNFLDRAPVFFKFVAGRMAMR